MQQPQEVQNTAHQIHVHPNDIHPVSIVSKKKGTRGRPSGKALVVTTTANKEELEQNLKRKEIKEKKKKTKKSKTVKRQVHLDEAGCSSSSSQKRQNVKTFSSSSEESADFSVYDQSSDDDEMFPLQASPENDPNCLFCVEKYSSSRSAEIWIQCAMCKGWAHEACAGPECDVYICDFCK
ncbi:hypothetical protein ABEB36_015810 [Hypothenemus hampei]|uniref:Zinc finger PHD-type domain-containing protein n=1 Tax=Hypothenemus hampei TaxID=57062 RepID=A0ABD1DYV2_HYPHA